MIRSYKAGDNLFTCDQCGGRYYASTAKTQWDGLVTCPRCFDPKHPQLEVRAVRDNPAAKIVRNPPDIFLYANDVYEPEVYLSGVYGTMVDPSASL